MKAKRRIVMVPTTPAVTQWKAWHSAAPPDAFEAYRRLWAILEQHDFSFEEVVFYVQFFRNPHLSNTEKLQRATKLVIEIKSGRLKPGEV